MFFNHRLSIFYEIIIFFLCGGVAAVLLLPLLLSLLASLAYVSKSKKSAVCGLELAEPVCPFCHMAAAVDTTTAAVPQFLDGPSPAPAPAAAAAAAVCLLLWS